VHIASSKAQLLPREAVLDMNLKEKQEAFERIFGTITESGNQEWLFAKLTGLPQKEYVSPAKRKRVSTVEVYDSEDLE